MGFKVGMPTLELKMGEKAASKNAKRFGNGRSICVEAGVERYSKTQNFDPSRSYLNAHLGPYESGDDAWDYIREQVADIEAKRKAQGKRAIRKDATIAHALIVKPDGEWVNAQTPEDVERFFDDAAEVLDELGIVPRDSIVMRERHMDEGLSDEEPCAHEHYVFMARTADGDLAGSRHLRLAEFKKLNRDFPRLMQARGWDCEELVGYDAEAAKSMSADERAEYKKQHIAKKQEHGLSANEYIVKKKIEKAEKRAAAAESKAVLRERANAEIKADSDAAWERMQQAKAEQKAAEEARDKAAQELADMEPRIKAVSKRETDVNARETSVKKREASVAASERGIAAKKAEADAALAAARRDAEAVAQSIEEEAERHAEETECKAAERASKMLDEAEALEADDKLTRFVRWTRALPDRGVYGRIKSLVDRFLIDDQKVVSERAKRTAKLRSQVDDIQRRGRGAEGYDF